MAWSFRCVDCVRTPNRCDGCKTRRAAAAQKRRAQLRRKKLCTECGRRPLAGLRLCAACNEANNARSAASHARARAELGA
jgi:hypothetical protein